MDSLVVNPRRSQDFARARDFRHSSCKRDVQKCWSTRGRSRALDIALSFLPAHRPPHAPPHPSSLLESGTQQFAPASSAHSADAASAHLEGKQHASSTTATLAGAAAIASSVTPSQSAHPLAARSTESLERFEPPSRPFASRRAATVDARFSASAAVILLCRRGGDGVAAAFSSSSAAAAFVRGGGCAGSPPADL